MKNLLDKTFTARKYILTKIIIMISKNFSSCRFFAIHMVKYKHAEVQKTLSKNIILGINYIGYNIVK